LISTPESGSLEDRAAGGQPIDFGGLPVSEPTLANVLREAGAAPPFYPRQWGFDEFFGFRARRRKAQVRV